MSPSKESQQPVQYKSMEDSKWILSYRFSDRPEPKDDSTSVKRDFYSGKLSLLFRADGYTDILSHESASTAPISVVKAWGWDVEKSSEEDKDYLLFSADVRLPKDKDLTARFYFQARQEVDRNGFISFREGTVTIKQDLAEAKKTPGLWGMFSPRGILAEFRYVGDFVIKPC
jgi:hypothetical protein